METDRTGMIAPGGVPIKPRLSQGCMRATAWRWQGYEEWADADTILTQVSLDPNFWGLLLFAMASACYLWQAAVPFIYGQNNYCNCDDTRPVCGGTGETTLDLTRSIHLNGILPTFQ